MGVTAPASQRRLSIRCRAEPQMSGAQRAHETGHVSCPPLSPPCCWAPTRGRHGPMGGASFSRSEARDCHAGGRGASASVWGSRDPHAQRRALPWDDVSKTARSGCPTKGHQRLTGLSGRCAGLAACLEAGRGPGSIANWVPPGKAPHAPRANWLESYAGNHCQAGPPHVPSAWSTALPE